MTKKKLISVLEGNAQEIPPIWLMRQAGRYLPEYREVRKQAGGFLDLCYTPELAEEVTLQPIRRFGMDAAILFADILLVPQAMGLDLWFVEGEGPRLSTVTERSQIAGLRDIGDLDDTLAPIYETVRRLSRSLPDDVALIGFAGAPWTVATYMVAGRGSPDQALARRFAYEDPVGFRELIDRISDATVHYLSSQIEAGAEVVKLFDSWAGSLSAAEFEAWSVAPAKRIVTALKARHPTVPVIGFPRGAGLSAAEYAATSGVDVLAAGQSTDMMALRERVGPDLVLQGNLDPLLMVIGGEPMTAAAKKLTEDMAGTPFVFNLGHGITPDADPENVAMLLDTIRSPGET